MLERLCSDVSDFQALKQPALREPLGTLERISQGLNLRDTKDADGDEAMGAALRGLGEAIRDVCEDNRLAVVDSIDWDAFEGHGAP